MDLGLGRTYHKDNTIWEDGKPEAKEIFSPKQLQLKAKLDSILRKQYAYQDQLKKETEAMFWNYRKIIWSERQNVEKEMNHYKFRRANATLDSLMGGHPVRAVVRTRYCDLIQLSAFIVIPSDL